MANLSKTIDDQPKIPGVVILWRGQDGRCWSTPDMHGEPLSPDVIERLRGKYLQLRIIERGNAQERLG